MLQDDWDGQGAEALDRALVDRAILLAQKLAALGCPAPGRVFASVNATVYFEWHLPLEYVEIEVASPLRAEYRCVQKGCQEPKVIYHSW